MQEKSTRDEALPWLRLTLVPGVSLAHQRTLLAAFGCASSVIAAPRSALVALVGEPAASLLAGGPDPKLLARTLDWLERDGNHVVTCHDPRYSALLSQIPDPPTVLYARGRVELLDRPAFAIVGSRNATPQGERDAEAFARALSEAGLAIASGLALGIDSAAHRGGLGAASSSIAVLGTGADVTYPRRNAALAETLAERGCVITEFALGMPPEGGNFPRRNRLISGLSRGVLVVEAAMKSGSLSTARSALEQDRDVFAIPGSIHSPLAKGCHWLIKEGAKLVENAQDILDELGWEYTPARDDAQRAEDAAEEKGDPILDSMAYAPVSLDQIAQRTGLGADKLAAHVSRLEIEGRIAALAGGWFQRLKKTRV